MADPNAELNPLEAYQRVLGFAALRGENALRLALHAGIPQVLRPELQHLIRLNFVPESLDDAATEADVLFAPFCAELGNDYYRFDANARLHLLTQLDPAYAVDAVPRSRQVAGFLLAWCERQGSPLAAEDDLVFAAFLDVERWVALAFFDPGAAAAQLAAAVKQASEGGAVAARIRIGGLASALATPLAGHGRLLAYAAGLEALEMGDVGRAEDLLEPLGDREVRVGEITLRSPLGLLKERARQVEPVGVKMPETPPEAEPELEKPVRDLIYVSYSHKDEKWARELETFLKPVEGLGIAKIWRDSHIGPGDDWVGQIQAAMARARLAVILASPAYLASKYLILEELPQLMDAAETNSLALIWVCVRPCAWQHSVLANRQAVHDPTTPLSNLRPHVREKVWSEIENCRFAPATQGCQVRYTGAKADGPRSECA